MKKNPEILKMIGQNPEAIERELKKDEEYSRLMESQDEELDEESKKILIEWIKQYRKRLFKDFENRKNKDETLQEFEIERKKIMLRKNPKFVLRNHLAEQCIKLAENKLFYDRWIIKSSRISLWWAWRSSSWVVCNSTFISMWYMCFMLFINYKQIFNIS